MTTNGFLFLFSGAAIAGIIYKNQPVPLPKAEIALTVLCTVILTGICVISALSARWIKH